MLTIRAGSGEVGRDARALLHNMIRSASLIPFQRICNPPLSKEQYDSLIQGARQELSRDDLRLYLNVYVFERRPVEASYRQPN